ncbi:hypothetical protein [Cognaticolwellia aestuarii]|jgi:hypothetical protein|uniref:hypothetical protein n=1 Tax=Cognaticolwellia aestuarii TaxID=329993 RepID=UPI00079AF50B|nr:hypothetical protein [Cognaticolwellia aestuarii]KXJ49907.1 MAG: hypothetical protein AXW17_10955 [Colwellia sp. Phe_37]|tara:strand:- start:326 stop:544 length:219 start_codon:yes stop_codon:yes gene_type:complete
MNIDTYADTDIDDDLNFDTGIAGFEIAYGSTNKTAMRKTAKQKYQVRKRLDSLTEKRSLDRQLNSLSDYWDM